MEINPIAKKLQIKPFYKILLLNAPEEYPAKLSPLPPDTEVNFQPSGSYDLVQLFVKNSDELREELKKLQEHLRPNTIFWITYPKKSSGIPSDLGMMQSWEETEKYGLQGVAAAAIDETWTALRFRPKEQIKKSESRNSEIAKNSYGDFIEPKNKTVTLPENIKTVLEKEPSAYIFFNTLSYSHRKEYVIWILSAKHEETKIKRLNKMLEMLSQGKKNPAAK